MQVAAVQLACGLDVAANRARVREVLNTAVAAGADLVVFPEGTQCGFGDPRSDPDLSGYAEPLDGPFVSMLADAVAASATTVVAGMFEPGSGHKVRNTIVVVGPAGLVGAYRKLHLFDALGTRESNRFEAAPLTDDALVTAPVAGMTVGVMNCYDLRFPEVARSLVDRGATVLVEPANWLAGPGKADAFVTLCRARAIESTAYLVAAAKPAPECAGCSMVVDPLGEVVASFGEDDEGVLGATLSPERVAEVRRALPVLEHRRFRVVPVT